jgi:hypothetical protein
MIISIYALFDPRFPEIIRYVGKTEKSLHHRLNRHLSDAKRGIKNHRCNWIRSLLDAGLIPTIKLLEIASEDNWKDCERRLIFENSKTITNCTIGGEGLCNPPVEVREKISKANKGRFLGIKKPQRSTSHCLAISLSNKGVSKPKHSEETKKKISEKTKGREWTQDSRDKMSKAHTGLKKPPLTDAHKAKLALKMTGRICSDEHKKKVSESKKRENLSEETLKRMSEAAKARNLKRYGKRI